MLGEQDHKRHLLPLLRDMEEKLQKRPKAEANTNRFNHIRANAMRSKNDDGDIILTFHTVSGRPERTKGKGHGGQRRRGPKVMESVDREFAAGAGKGGGKGRGGVGSVFGGSENVGPLRHWPICRRQNSVEQGLAGQTRLLHGPSRIHWETPVDVPSALRSRLR